MTCASSSPAVSILIPTYNYARYLPEAIDSVLAQDCRDCEIIISDDASTDGSAALLEQQAARDPRIQLYVHGSNLGMVANWNWCLQRARGRYVKFLFGDDMFLGPSALSTLCDMLDRHPDAVLASSARQVVDEHSRPVTIWNRLTASRPLVGLQVIVDCLYHDTNLIGEPSAVLFRREPAQRGFDPALRQIVDLEMWFHLLTQGNLIHTDLPLCGFRQHANQQTVKNRGACIGPQESLAVTARYLQLLARYHSEFARQCILYRRLHYSRKRIPRTPEVMSMEAQLSTLVRKPWFHVARLRHRLLRPAQNLVRFLHP